MGAHVSPETAVARTSLQAIPTPDPPAPVAARLLQLPADIVSYICREHLQPDSVAALALTCKALYGLLFERAKLALDDHQRQELQLLLEKDMGHSWWYCHTCSVLHAISAQGPTGYSSHQPLGEPDRRPHDSQFLCGSGFSIDYQTVRLVMNRHFYGPPMGLALEDLSLKRVSLGRLRWNEAWSAKILRDELFISSTRTLSGMSWNERDLRAALDGECYELCAHVSTTGPSYSVAAALRRPAFTSMTNRQFFIPCHDVIASCDRCLTDYAVTVERRLIEHEGGEDPAAHWFITIISYHSLGSCRSPWGLKWKAFARSRAFPTQRRDMMAYPLGAIKAAWESIE